MSLQGPIVVPLDGSELAEHALPSAVGISRRSGAPLRLVHVHVTLAADPIYVEGLPVIDERLRPLRHEHERAYLEQARERLAPDAAATVELLEGRPAPALAAYARACGAALTVMTTHGRGGLERAWLGSVADDLIRLSPVPLLLLRPEPDRVAARFHRVLVPLDGSPRAEAILAPALALARLDPGAELVLLDVVRPIRSMVWAGPAAPVTHDVEQGRAESARRYLEQLAGRLDATGVGIRTRTEVADAVAPAILAAARDEQADLLALTTHGRSGLGRVALGSVADKLLRGSRTPILLLGPSCSPVAQEAGG